MRCAILSNAAALITHADFIFTMGCMNVIKYDRIQAAFVSNQS